MPEPRAREAVLVQQAQRRLDAGHAPVAHVIRGQVHGIQSELALPLDDDGLRDAEDQPAAVVRTPNRVRLIGHSWSAIARSERRRMACVAPSFPVSRVEIGKWWPGVRWIDLRTAGNSRVPPLKAQSQPLPSGHRLGPATIALEHRLPRRSSFQTWSGVVGEPGGVESGLPPRTPSRSPGRPAPASAGHRTGPARTARTVRRRRSSSTLVAGSTRPGGSSATGFWCVSDGRGDLIGLAHGAVAVSAGWLDRHAARNEQPAQCAGERPAARRGRSSPSGS